MGAPEVEVGVVHVGSYFVDAITDKADVFWAVHKVGIYPVYGYVSTAPVAAITVLVLVAPCHGQPGYGAQTVLRVKQFQEKIDGAFD